MSSKKRYNFFYCKVPITRKQFENAVPDYWENEIDKYGEYSFGYYRAVLLDEEENDGA